MQDQAAGLDNQLATDKAELAAFGYKQEFVRTLGAFSTFATGFAFISILTGAFQLFAFAYGNAGPGMWWAWVAAVIGQLLFALAFAELAVRYPLAGSVYNWTKQLARPAVSWLAGISLTLALTVSTAAVALALQFVLPTISSAFWLYGDGTGPRDAATNGVILGTIMIVGTTIVSLLGTKVVALVNNIGVVVELIAVTLIIVLFAVNAQRGPQIVLETNGTGANHSTGYFGALLISVLLGLYIMWGFDTAGSMGEETVNPRKTNPKAIIRALLASGVLGGLLILTALMATKNLDADEVSLVGLPFIVKDVLGDVVGNLLLACVAIAIFVCGLANQTGAVRMLYAMARDDALPASGAISRLSASRAPVVPIVLVAVVAVAVLLYNIGQAQVFLVVTSTTVILALFAYVIVMGAFSLKRLRGQWTRPERGYFTLGSWGLVVSLAAFLWGSLMIINIAWPRRAIYNPFEPFHWYLQWGGVLFPVVALGAALVLYFTVVKGRVGIRAEHRVDTRATSEPVG